MDVSEFKKLPNKFFYFVAKEYLKFAYPKAHVGFFDFEIKRNIKKAVQVKCFNGGGWVYLTFAFHDNEWRIKRTGNYAKHRRVNSCGLIKKAMSNIDKIKEYYEIRFQENISTFVRCVCDIEAGKKEVLRQWDYSGHSKIEEPIKWIVVQV